MFGEWARALLRLGDEAVFEPSSSSPLASRFVAFVSWMLPLFATAAALSFCVMARGDWLKSASMMGRCSSVVEVGGVPALGLALVPILLGGFGLGFFTFAGRDLDGRARVCGLFLCLASLAACAMSLEAFSEHARSSARECELASSAFVPVPTSAA